MFIWNLRKLKKEIIQNKIGQAETFKYFLAYMLINVIVMEIKTSSKLSSSILNIVTTIIGTIYCYYCNGASKGDSFIERYIIIGLVVAIRYLFLVCLPSIIVFILLLETFDFLNRIPHGDELLFALLVVGFYWKLGVNIKIVSKISKNSS